MSIWEEYSPIMDDTVDAVLGDTISLAIDGITFADQPGFVIIDSGANGTDALDDQLGVRKRVKMRKTIIGRPSLDQRLRHPELGPGTYRPTGSEPETEGRYWVFDVQKAST